MKQLTILILLIFYLPAQAQENAENAQPGIFNRFRIGVNISPDLCYRTLKSRNESPSGSFIEKNRNDMEIPKIGYTFGLNACYNFTGHLGLEWGAQYSNNCYQTKMYDLYFGSGITPTGPTGPPDARVKYIYNTRYIDMPVRVNYTFGERKVKYCTSAGLTPAIFVNETSVSIATYMNGRTDRNVRRGGTSSFYNYNVVTLSPTLSGGIDIKINSKVNLRVEGIGRYSVIKVVKTSLSEYLWNVGLNITCFFALYK